MEKKPEWLKDDETWLKAGADESSDSSPDAMLREVMVDAELSEAAREDIEHDWHRLRFALKKRKRFSKSAGYMAQAAVVLLLIGSVYMMLPNDQRIQPGQSGMEEALMRGKQSQEIYSDDIPSEAARIAGRLKAMGVTVIPKLQKEKAELEITLRYPLSPEVVGFLHEEEVEVPKSGNLILIVLPRAKLN
jgi:hypothetical protein